MRASSRLKLAAGAVLLAVTLYALAAAPGLLSDRDSFVPVSAPREAQR